MICTKASKKQSSSIYHDVAFALFACKPSSGIRMSGNCVAEVRTVMTLNNKECQAMSSALSQNASCTNSIAMDCVIDGLNLVDTTSKFPYKKYVISVLDFSNLTTCDRHAIEHVLKKSTKDLTRDQAIVLLNAMRHKSLRVIALNLADRSS